LDALCAALDGLNPDEMTPREALEALYRLKAARASER
jgi:DNA mismatch repair protein MutS